MDPTVSMNEQATLPACDEMAWMNEIGGQYLKVEPAKVYECWIYKAPKTEKDPFGEEGDLRRTYELEHEGRLVLYNPGAIWERQLKAAITQAKVRFPIRFQFQKIGDGKLTEWNIKILPTE